MLRDSYLNAAASIKGLGGLEFLEIGKSFSLQKLAQHDNISTAPGKFEGPQALFLATLNSGTGGAHNVHGIWTAGKSAFAGFLFKTNTTAGAKTDYGWVRLVFTESTNLAPDSIAAVDWGYAVNMPSSAGQNSGAPEPSTLALALLAAGAAGVAVLRRRRKSA